MIENSSLTRREALASAAARYVDAFFANAHWDEVQRRLEAARKA